jgi:hypothetical protein
MENHLKKIIFALLAIWSISASAYDPNITSTKALEQIKQIDCSNALKECRYYAAVEYIAFFESCKNTIASERHNPVTAKENANYNKVIQNWGIFKDPLLKYAVLQAPNLLKDKLIHDTTSYLKTISQDEKRQECSRFGIAKNNGNPENNSEILQLSRNYGAWQKSHGIKVIDKK